MLDSGNIYSLISLVLSIICGSDASRQSVPFNASIPWNGGWLKKKKKGGDLQSTEVLRKERQFCWFSLLETASFISPSHSFD